MSLVEKLCKEIGVEVEEVWMGNDGWHYCINDSGELISKEYKDNLEEDEFSRLDNISRVLSGELKPIWEPKLGETYYVPSITIEEKYILLTWTETRGDKRNQERGAVFKTKEEAIAAANKMIEFIKEERENE